MSDAAPNKRDDVDDHVAVLTLAISVEGVCAVSYDYDDDPSRKALVRALLEVAGDLALGEADNIVH